MSFLNIYPGFGKKCIPVTQDKWIIDMEVHFHLNKDGYMRCFMENKCAD